MDKNELQMQLLSYKFCLQELGLYLDSHPHDQAALTQFQQCKENYNSCKAQYVREVGPLVREDVTSTEHWNWIDGPWPWEYKEDDK